MKPFFKGLFFFVAETHGKINLFQAVILFPGLNRLHQQGAVH